MDYDVIVLGGGPAGLTAALYSARGGAKTLVIEKFAAGGQASLTPEVENYPGIFKVSGADLTDTMRRQAEAAGAEILCGDAGIPNLSEKEKSVGVGSTVYRAKSVILATGASSRRLGLKREEALTGQGISYCATCDGAFFKKKPVAVVGGGNTALTDALYLKNIASEVSIIHRRNEFRASPALVAKLGGDGIRRFLDSVVTELIGEPLSAITVENLKTGKTETIATRGLFIAAGRAPETAGFPEVILNENGFILTDENMKTAIRGVFAAGDAREKPLRQIVTAAADGAIAAESALEFLRGTD